MASVNRRTFLAGLIGAPVLAAFAPAIVAAAPEVTEMVRDHAYPCSYRTPNGETITGMQEFSGRLYVFTASSIYVVPGKCHRETR